MKTYELKSFAKINLALHVTGKLTNLHKIESVVNFIDLHDKIFIKEINSNKHNISFIGNFSKNIKKDNTVSKLFKVLEDKKILNKKNTFYDFIDATKSLINQGYGNSKNVYAMGGSAGGLLMGAIINMEPELYTGIISAVPFVDVVTTMSDETIPLTTFEYKEWGNPANEDEYNYIKSYSPYDNIKPSNYPAVLVTSSLHDSQVQYYEPAKYVPKLRENSTSDNPILMAEAMKHAVISGRKAYEAKRMKLSNTAIASSNKKDALSWIIQII